MDAWIGVDFDHTLCDEHGEPVPEMVSLVKTWLEVGLEVRIVTARVNPIDHDNDEIGMNTVLIYGWCEEHLGRFLTIQWGKSSGMIELWDDKVVLVESDTGKRLSPSSVEQDIDIKWDEPTI